MLQHLIGVAGHSMTAYNLPHFKDRAGCAWTIWGEGDQLGTVNLLTDAVVQRAAQEEIKCAASFSLRIQTHISSEPARLFLLTGKTLFIMLRNIVRWTTRMIVCP